MQELEDTSPPFPGAPVSSRASLEDAARDFLSYMRKKLREEGSDDVDAEKDGLDFLNG